MINKDINKYIDLLPRNFRLSILVAVHISSKFCLRIIIHSKTVIGKSTIFPTIKNGRGLYLTRVLLND